MSRRALITGVTGQDGCYLASLLVSRGYEVYGASRAESLSDPSRVARLPLSVMLRPYDLACERSLTELITQIAPHEIYHLAGPTYVPDCLADPLRAAEDLALAPLRLLEVMRVVDPSIRFFQAGSSQSFGAAAEVPQCETTPFRPANPYGAAKAFAHWAVGDYRRRYDLFACNGILFNHESPLRDQRFVTRKISLAAARIALGQQSQLVLGDLNARRDWGYAGDFVKAMHAMLGYREPGDYVIATGAQHSVREFVQLAFAVVDLDWRQFVKTDQGLYRVGDAGDSVGDASRAYDVLGWRPETSFAELVGKMVAADLQQLGAEATMIERALQLAREKEGTNLDL